jgi:hypothetical protein
MDDLLSGIRSVMTFIYNENNFCSRDRASGGFDNLMGITEDEYKGNLSWAPLMKGVELITRFWPGGEILTQGQEFTKLLMFKKMELLSKLRQTFHESNQGGPSK